MMPSEDDQISRERPQHDALMKVAEAAAVLFRPPYRRFAGIVTSDGILEAADFNDLYQALNDPMCPVGIGEELT